MASPLTNQLIEQLDSTLALFKEVRGRSRYDDLSDGKYADLHGFIAKGRAAITRISGTRSAYSKHVQEVMSQNIYDGAKACMIKGIVDSLKADLEAGYIQQIEELIHGEVFADFLEMAGHLIDEGYKDAAAVIAGSSLEGHLRQLCTKYGVETEITTDSGQRLKKADRINSNLVKREAYSKLDHKNITAWLDLRNKAAHGKYDEYTKEQVSLLISGIRDFITRITA